MEDKRLDNILEKISCMAALDFSRELATSQESDMIDAISVGLNMLSEELSSQVVARAALDKVNSKLEQFAYTTAHDLKAPLNNQIGLLNLLELSLTSVQSTEAQEYITKIKAINLQMKNLVEGILAYSVVRASEMLRDQVDLNEILMEVMNADDVMSRAEVRVVGVLPVVYFNRTACVQVVRNLLDNAIKYSDKDTCCITISSSENSAQYEITFEDNGPGIAKKDQEKIFKLFNRSEPYFKPDSVGIGLATVKGIIEAAGGSVQLKSAIGKGAAFTFSILKRSDH